MSCTAPSRLCWILIALASAGISCTRHEEKPVQAEAEHRTGAFPFQFDHQTATDLTLMKNDPKNGQIWSVSVRRTSTVSEARPRWEIVSAPEGRTLLDRRADSIYIMHLLDTLRTLERVDQAPQGSAESFGLVSPRFSLRWTAEGGTRSLDVGDDLKDDQGTYVRTGSDVFVAKGAIFRMLGYLGSFDFIRQRVLLTLGADDVDEYEFFRDGKRVFYAQREGDGWVDRSHRSLKTPVGSLLDALVHLRIRSFIDDAETSRKILPTLASAPRYRFVFKDRQGHALELKAARQGTALRAWVSSRPEAVFELYPEAERHFMIR